MSVRVGIGYDSHRFAAGRPLRLGGHVIPHTHGLVGHSDGDAVLHAITDAILGAAALGDIGRMFPDDDPKFRDADSRALLRTAVARVAAAGWRIGNVDATVIAERPKIGPHVAAMRAAVAAECGIDVGAVNIKGKTSEKLGYAGRGEGIAAQAVVLLMAD